MIPELENKKFNPLMGLVALTAALGRPLGKMLLALQEVRRFALPDVARGLGLIVMQAVNLENDIVVGFQGRYEGRHIFTTLSFTAGLAQWEWEIRVIDPDFQPILGVRFVGRGHTILDAEPYEAIPEAIFTRAVANDLLKLIHTIIPDSTEIEQTRFHEWLEANGLKRVFNYEWAIPCTTLAANWCAADMVVSQECLDNAHTFAEAWDYFNERLGKFQNDSAYTAMFEQSRQHYLRAIANELLNAYGLVTSQRDKGLMGLRNFISTKCYDAMNATMTAGEALPNGSRLIATALYKIASLHADFQANG